MSTRREFLTAMAAAAVAPLPRVQPAQRRGPTQRVLVIGGGAAGLCAPDELQKRGHPATGLEAQTRPGGRVRTLRTFAPGVYTEAGAETIPGAHEVTQQYARELGLPLVPTTVPGMRSCYTCAGAA